MASVREVDSNRLSEMGLRECASDCRHFKDIIDNVLKCYTDTAEDIMELRDTYGVDGLIDVIHNVEEPLLEIASRHYGIDNIKKTVNDGTNLLQQYYEQENNQETISDVFERQLQEFKRQDTCDVKYVSVAMTMCYHGNSSHPVVKAFKEIVTDREEEEEEEEMEMAPDEELVMGQVQRSLTCPLTTRQLENPVKNKTCGHVYSKEAILGHVRSRPKGRARCPVGGCPEVILEANLEEDKEMERALRRAERQRH